jgi:hypothetical protein
MYRVLQFSGTNKDFRSYLAQIVLMYGQDATMGDIRKIDYDYEYERNGNF